MGGDVDDAAFAARDHCRINRLRHEEHALQVHADDPVELSFRVFLKRFADIHTGIVEQDVDRAERSRRFLGERLGGGNVGYIDRPVHDAASQRPYIRGRCLGLRVIVQMAERDIGALGGEQQRCRTADAAGPTGDQSNLILELHGACLLRCADMLPAKTV